jgi:thiol-disulfide isomerase/thioredoxin
VRITSRWRRSRGLVATLAAVIPLIVAASPQAANAAIQRTASTTSYNTATYLQDDLGFPGSDTSPVIQPVTYDYFQWILQQPGNSAVLVGDPAEDANFASQAQAVETQAQSDGIKEIYWFDPNLSGGNATASGTTVGGTVGGSDKPIYEPNLDIRNPANVGALAGGGYAIDSASQQIYGNAWDNLVSQFLGDGVTETLVSPDTESAQVTSVSLGVSTAINDSGNTAGDSTELVNGAVNASGGALYDYTSGSAPANVSDSYFFIYNGAGTVPGTSNPAKIVSWFDLDSEYSAGGATQLNTDLGAALAAAGGSSKLTGFSQFNWWQSEGNLKQTTAQGSAAQGGNVPLLTDSDNSAADGGWRIDQITYPELVDLLKSSTSQTAVILFGGTWCPNTRPVLPFVNQYAQQNNTEVFNFDTVLDGGTTAGGTTSSVNPLQVRNTAAYSPSKSTTYANANPTFLYGDLVNAYLKNIDTQYNPYTSSSFVSYYPGGVASNGEDQINKLQVPFLVGYQAADGGGVNRQWIINNGGNSYTEYMSSWQYTNPQPGELGLSQIPQDAAIWSTIDSELANVSYATNPATIDPNSAIDSDDAQYLDGTDYALVTNTSTVVTVKSDPSSVSGTIPISPSALSAALAALGSAAPANYAAAKAAYLAALAAGTPNATLISNLETVVGAWGVAELRKTALLNAWGNATTPGSVIGGLAADQALNVFFGGLPGGVVSTQTVSASVVNYGADLQINVAVANPYGRLPTGNVSLTLSKGGSTVATQSAAIVNNQASFTVPVSAAGDYGYGVAYAGDDQIVAFSDSGSITVKPQSATTTTTPTATTAATVTPAAAARIKVRRVIGAVTKAPTSRARGRYEVTVATPNGLATATGRITVTLKKGHLSKTLHAALDDDRALVSLPKLARGRWQVRITWAGDADYLAITGSGATIRVVK